MLEKEMKPNKLGMPLYTLKREWNSAEFFLERRKCRPLIWEWDCLQMNLGNGILGILGCIVTF